MKCEPEMIYEYSWISLRNFARQGQNVRSGGKAMGCGRIQQTIEES